jgi:hypothetical protein
MVTCRSGTRISFSVLRSWLTSKRRCSILLTWSTRCSLPTSPLPFLWRPILPLRPWGHLLMRGWPWALPGQPQWRRAPYSGHVNQVNAAAWLPWLLLGADRFYWQRSLPWALAVGVMLALQFLAGHAQPSYLTAATLAAYWLMLAAWDLATAGRPWSYSLSRHGKGEGAREPVAARRETAPVLASFLLPAPMRWLAGRAGRPLVSLVLWGVAGMATLGLVAAQLLPMLQLTRYSIRQGGLSYGEAASFSLSPRQALAGLLPTPDGLVTTAEYYGFIGILACAVALLAVVAAYRRPVTWAFTFLAVGALALALGAHNPLYPVLFQIVPGLDLFRVPARWLLIYSLAASMLVGIGLDWLQREGSALSLSKGTGARLITPPLRSRRPVVLRFLVGTALVVAVAVALFPFQRPTPPLPMIATWVVLTLAGVLLVLAALRWPVLVWVLPLLIVGELFWASRHLEYNQTTAPIAYTDPGPVSALLRQQTSDGRLLSLAATEYEPGNAAFLREAYAHLGERGVLALLITQKYFEVMTPNTPLAYRRASADGYDGGILPTQSYVQLKGLLVPGAEQEPDRLLRQQLSEVPAPRLLDLLGVRYLLKDKVHDLWVDGVYYDTTFNVLLSPEQPATVLPNVPDQAASTLGILSYLTEAAALRQGEVVAELRLTMQDGTIITLPLQAGIHTAEGQYGKGNPTHQAVRQVATVPRRPDLAVYHALVDLGTTARLARIEVRYLAATGRLHVQAISLSGPQGHAPVVLSTEPVTVLFSGDVKVYQRDQALDRTYGASQVYIVDTPEAALRLLGSEDFRPGRDVVLQRSGPFTELPPRNALTAALRPLKHWLQRLDLWGGGPPLGLLMPEEEPGLGTPVNAGGFTTYRLAIGASPPQVKLQQDAPERVVVSVQAETPTVLVLADSFLPGWQAEVDGAPATIWRANYHFRGVLVPAGTHTVTFRYGPAPFRVGAIISFSTVPTLAVFWLLSLVIPHWRRS